MLEQVKPNRDWACSDPGFFECEENMKATPTSMIAILLAFQLGTVWAQSPSDSNTAPEMKAASEPTPGSTKPAAAASTAPPEKPTSVAKEPEPITGAFGMTLGERFEASMVAKVLEQQEQSYRGAEGQELKGTLFVVEPSQPDQHFQNYSVKTTDNGTIYAIQADYQFEREQVEEKQEKAKQTKELRSTCKTAVKDIAAELRERYGKPRGMGWDGEWYVFRQTSESTDKRVRLFANRCRSGIYSIVYADEALLGQQQQSE
jgi:hypothetical protein